MKQRLQSSEKRCALISLIRCMCSSQLRNFYYVLKVPSLIAKVETMSDGGLKLIVHTQELVPSDEAEVMHLRNKIGWFLFSVTDIVEDDIPSEAIEFQGQKTLSERLRNVLFRLHEAQGGKPEDFESYWVKIMESLINNYKSKLAEYDQDRSF